MRQVQPRVPHSLKTAMRAVWLPIARSSGYPISSPRLHRPPLLQDRKPIWLSHALTACDLNPDYLEYWSHTKRAWLEIVGIEPMLVLIADDGDIPAELSEDPYVVSFAPIPGVHTALQAQCIRLLYPALVETEGAVVITDVDLYPLRRSYFVDPIKSLDSRFFVSYRDDRLNKSQIAIAYNAATPATWSDVFGISSVEDVRSRLEAWTSSLEYDGRRAWPGWYTDQEILYRVLTQWPEAPRRWWVMDDVFTKHRQLTRLDLEREEGLSARRRNGIRRGAYSDYICLFPYNAYRDVNDEVLKIALESQVRSPQ